MQTILINSGNYIVDQISSNRKTKLNNIFFKKGLATIIPRFVIVGLASNITVLYVGLALYSLGELNNFLKLEFLSKLIVLLCFSGSAIVIPCLTSMTAAYGRADQKGAVIGTLRSLGALARAVGPLASSFGRLFKFQSTL